MELKPSSWLLDHLPDAMEIDFAESTSITAAEQEPGNSRRVAIGHTSKSEERDYAMARLHAIGFNVGRRAG